MEYAEWFDDIFSTDESVVQDRARSAADRLPDVDPVRAVEYLTRCFTQARSLLRLPQGHVAGGLFRLANSCEGDHVRALRNRDVHRDRQYAGWQSMATLFEDFFAVTCRTYIGHQDSMSKTRGPLDIPCYMWWDAVPLWPDLNDPDEVATLPAILEVLNRSLATDSVTCQESAIHGFDIYGEFFRAETVETLTDYLDRTPPPHPLRGFALYALDSVRDDA